MSDAAAMLKAIREAVEADDASLTEWEDTFLVSIAAVIEAGRDLSDRQDAALERIWSRIVKGD